MLCPLYPPLEHCLLFLPSLGKKQPLTGSPFSPLDPARPGSPCRTEIRARVKDLSQVQG